MFLNWFRRPCGVAGRPVAMTLAVVSILAATMPAEAQRRTRPPAPIRGPVTMTEADFERYITGAPSLAPTYQALRQYYPDAYLGLRGLVIATYNRRGLIAARDVGFNYMLQFVLSKSAAIANASDEDLHEYATVNAAMIRQLGREDVAQCARIVMSGPSPSMRLSATLLVRLNAVNVVQMRAARHGEDNPVQRAAPMPEDAAALRARVEAIDPAIVAVFDAGIQSGTPAQQCAAGAILLEAMASLPADQGARLISQILRAAAAAVTGRQI